MASIGILGAGTWGIALARHLANNEHAVCVWSALPQELEDLARTHTQKNLPGMVIPDTVSYTPDIATAVADKNIVLFAVPSVFVRSVAKQAAPHLPEGQIVVDVAKGIEPHTMRFLTQVIDEELQAAGVTSARLVALSGPTHAEEVARDLPTTIVSASRDLEAAQYVQEVFMSPLLRVYTNTDILGVELCGALKNAIALASGISRGLGYGDNSAAALICRGMEEIKRLGMALGCNERTFDGLAGIGDLVVTATSQHSRNNRCGQLIGQGLSAQEAVKEVGMVVEGINVLEAAREMAATYGVEMPLVDAVSDVVEGRISAREAAAALMGRERKGEISDDPTSDHPSELDYLSH